MSFTGKLNGQWMGRYEGSNEGLIVLELDDFESHYAGRAYAFDDDPNLPNFVMAVETSSKLSNFEAVGDVKPLDPETGAPTDWNRLQGLYPTVAVPQTASFEFMVVGARLQAKWSTDIGTSSAAILTPSTGNDPSDLQPLTNVTNWSEFKQFVGTLGNRRHIFRGQDRPYRLRTAFHRSGRADLARYMEDDIPTLHRYLGGRLLHNLRLSDPTEQWTFLNLIQHHGYPTPLLDWSYSPYVAAYFAYVDVSPIRVSASENIRIFVFDSTTWISKHKPISFLAGRRRQISMMEFGSLNNDRLIPQQSLSMATNIDDLEGALQQWSHQDKVDYIRVIDLPTAERPTVMRELSLMGITAGALFPGLDGACAELKERNFPQ